MSIKEFLIYTLLFIISLVSTVPAGTYTLDALLEIGFVNSREIKLVEEEMKKAEAQEWEYYGKAMPTIDFSTNYQYSRKQFNPMGLSEDAGDMSITKILIDSNVTDQGSYIIAAMLDGMMQGLTPKKHMASVGVSLTQPIFAQGKVLHGLKIAKLYNRALLCKWQETKMTVRANITKLFYSALLAENNVAIQKNAVTLALEAHRLAVLRFGMGSGTELDTLNTRLHLEDSRIGYQESQQNKRMALDAIIKATGIPEQVDSVVLEGDFPDEDYHIDLHEAIERVQSENKKVIQLNVTREIQKLMVKIAKSEYLPLVYCGGSVSKITQFNKDEHIEWQDDQRLYIGLTYTLFNGTQREQKIKQAKADARSIEQTRELAIEKFELAARKTWEDLETSRKKLEQARSLCTLAEKAYNVSKKAYEMGGITLLDFQDSEQKLNSARMALNAAQFTFHSAVVDMRVLMGSYMFD